MGKSGIRFPKLVGLRDTFEFDAILLPLDAALKKSVDAPLDKFG